MPEPACALHVMLLGMFQDCVAVALAAKLQISAASTTNPWWHAHIPWWHAHIPCPTVKNLFFLQTEDWLEWLRRREVHANAPLTRLGP